MNVEEYRKAFPVLKDHVYLNTAASGLLYDGLVEWRKRHDQEFSKGGSIFRMQQYELLEEVRKTVAVEFGAEDSRVFLTPNFSIGINVIARQFQQKKVLLLEGDYPSLVQAFELGNFEIVKVPISVNVEEAIEQTVQKETPDILALSLVQYISGLKIDLEFLKKLKAVFPNLAIIADGTQFCGTAPFDFESSGIDILAASGYKWLLGGYGCGFVLTTPQAHDDFFTQNGSHLFEPGHVDSLNFGSLKYSLDHLSDIGWTTISERMKTLSMHAKDVFCDLGLIDRDLHDREHSTIFNIPGDSQLFEKLSDQKIVCAQRGNGIRFSFHWYNTLDEIDFLKNVLVEEL